MRKHKFTSLILSILCLTVAAGSFTACGHEHTYSDEWTKTTTEHYHAATCEHKDEKKDAGKHTYGGWETVKEPTETEEGKKQRKCSVCEYAEEETIPATKHEHTFATTWSKDASGHWYAATCAHTNEKKDFAAHTYGGWVTVKEPTETEEGKKQRKCSVCEYAEEETIPATKHEHTFAATWSKDASGHWYAATCAHTNEKKDFAAHTYGEWVTVKEPTETEKGKKQRTCSVCDYVEEEEIAETSHEHTFETTWSKDESGHWYAATCGHDSEKKDFATHTYGEWQVVDEPDDNIDGLKKHVCSVCGYEETDVIKADPTPDDEGQLSPYRFEAEKAVLGNSRNADHFCTGNSLEFSPSFSGNLAICNMGTSSITFTFNSDKAVRSKLYLRMSNQNATESEGLLSRYADITINGKHFVDLTQKFNSENAEAAEGCNNLYFTMVTLETSISIAEGENVLVITLATANWLNLDYIEINTSATLKDTTKSTLTSTDFMTVATKPTETSTGKISPDCHYTPEEGTACGNQNKRGRDLPALDNAIYEKTETADKVAYAIEILGEKIEVASTTFKLTAAEGVTFHGGKTSDFVVPGSQVELVYTEPSGQILSYWKDELDADLGEEFVMPERSLTITPVFIEAVEATVTLQGATLDGSATVSTYVGRKIDLSKAVIANIPEGKALKGWSILSDRTKIFAGDKYKVTGSVTLIPVFDSQTFLSKTNTVGKIAATGKLFGDTGKVNGCYSLLPNLSTGAINSGNGYYETGSIYRFKGGTADNPTDNMAVGSHFLTQEMNGLLTQGNLAKTHTVTTTVENFGTQDVTLRFALIKSSGDPNNSQYGENTVTIPAGETVTFTFDITYIHGSVMLNMMVKEEAVSEVYIGVYQYVSEKN